jgi:hypothetical protein
MPACTLIESAPQSPLLTSQHLEDVFQHIHDLIGQHAALANEAARCIEYLRSKCEAQFDAEENSSLVQEVGEQAPWLERHIADLARQHGALRRRLSSLGRSLERRQPLPRCWEEFAEELSFFERQLYAHESAEIDFWQEVCIQDIGTKD